MTFWFFLAFSLVRVQYDGGGDWYNDPDVLPNLAREARARVGLEVDTAQVVLRLDDPRIFDHPFLYLTGHGNIYFSDEEARNLRMYLERGGFLYADDDYGMDEAFRREMRKVFPEATWIEVPFDHPIYHIVYDFPQGLPKIHEHYPGPPKGLALVYRGRIVVFYTYNTNISDGWTPSHNDPPEKREEAFRMGVNILTYALMY